MGREGEARTCPPAQFSLSAFPITRESLLISKDTALKRNSSSLSLSFSLDERRGKSRYKEEKKKTWKRKEGRSVEEKKSVISNREKVLLQQTTTPLLSFFPSSSLSLVILLLVRVPIVYPATPPFRPFINRGIAHPRKYGVRKSFKLPHGTSFAFLFKPR